MPPPAVKTVRALIYWQYAKIIAHSAGIGKREYRFIMNRFKKMQNGDIFWNEIREYIKEREKKDECIFCGSKADLTLEHMFPASLGGPDDEKNVVWVCKRCNSAKSNRRLYEYYTVCKGLECAKYHVPRIAEGKYLKFLYDLFERHGVLDISINDLRARICPYCDLKTLCKEHKTEGKLSPLCLDGLATLCLQKS